MIFWGEGVGGRKNLKNCEGWQQATYRLSEHTQDGTDNKTQSCAIKS